MFLKGRYCAQYLMPHVRILMMSCTKNMHYLHQRRKPDITNSKFKMNRKNKIRIPQIKINVQSETKPKENKYKKMVEKCKTCR